MTQVQNTSYCIIQPALDKGINKVKEECPQSGLNHKVDSKGIARRRKLKMWNNYIQQGLEQYFNNESLVIQAT